MGDIENGWNLTEAAWSKLIDRAKGNADVLEDGAHVRATPSTGDGVELWFYASVLNKPAGWRYAFVETIGGTSRHVARVGRAWRHAATGFVEFDVEIDAAGRALAADYEGGVGDFDDATFEQEVDRAIRGTEADRDWLKREFDRLTKVGN